MTKNQLRYLKAATKELTQWGSSKKAFAHYQKIKKGVTEITGEGAHNIYEFYCYLRILDDLRKNYKVKFRKGTITGKIFPEKPFPKVGWPYFVIENKNTASNKYQVCYGTNIKLSYAAGTTIAPDISFQKYDSSVDPDETMVELIMDAKFIYSYDKKLTIDRIHAFIQRVSALKTGNVNSLHLDFDTLSSIKSNCLLTNGLTADKHINYCKAFKIKQVGRFDVKKTFNVAG